MERKKEKIAQLFSFLSMGFMMLSVPFYFLKMFSKEGNAILENTKNVSVIKLFALGGAGEQYSRFSVFATLAVFAIILIILFEVFSVFKAKVLKIVCFSLSAVILALNIIICAATVSYSNSKKIEITLSVSYGTAFIIVFSALAFALALTAFIITATIKEKKEKVDGFVSYDIPVDIIGKEQKREIISGGMNAYPASEGMPMAKGTISIVSGSCKGFSIPISDGETVVIGKDPTQCAIVIDKKHTAVSRRHCEIGFDSLEEVFLVKDCSANGTFLENGTRLANGIVQRLPRGTMITLAKTENILKLE